MEQLVIFIKRYWLLILLVATLCAAGGCVSQQERLLQNKQQEILESYRESVTAIVDDPVRARQLIDIAEKLNLEMKADTRVLLETTAKIKKLNGAAVARNFAFHPSVQPDGSLKLDGSVNAGISAQKC